MYKSKIYAHSCHYSAYELKLKSLCGKLCLACTLKMYSISEKFDANKISNCINSGKFWTIATVDMESAYAYWIKWLPNTYAIVVCHGKTQIGLDQRLCCEYEISRGDTVSCGMLGSPQPENSDAALSARRVRRNKDTSSVGYICFSSSLLLSLFSVFRGWLACEQWCQQWQLNLFSEMPQISINSPAEQQASMHIPDGSHKPTDNILSQITFHPCSCHSITSQHKNKNNKNIR